MTGLNHAIIPSIPVILIKMLASIGVSKNMKATVVSELNMFD